MKRILTSIALLAVLVSASATELRSLYLPPHFKGETLQICTVTFSNLTVSDVVIIGPCGVQTSLVGTPDQHTVKYALSLDLSKVHDPFRIQVLTTNQQLIAEYVCHLTIVPVKIITVIRKNHYHIINTCSQPLEVVAKSGEVDLNIMDDGIQGSFKVPASITIKDNGVIQLTNEE